MIHGVFCKQFVCRLLHEEQESCRAMVNVSNYVLEQLNDKSSRIRKK
jgi:hypothetical protein